MKGYNHIFRKKEIDLFFTEGLDRANRVDAAWEIGFSARVVSTPQR
jgi:hypothetical protein